MAEFEVTVYTRVKETYYVEAQSEQEALSRWSDSDPEQSECVEVEDVFVRTAGDG